MPFSCLCRVRRADAAAAAPVMFQESYAFAAGDSDAATAPVMFKESYTFAAGDSDAATAPVMFEESDAPAISLSEDDRLEL